MAQIGLHRVRVDVWLTVAGWTWVLYTAAMISAALSAFR